MGSQLQIQVRSVCSASRWLPPGQPHGIVGGVEALLPTALLTPAQETRSSAWRGQGAFELGLISSSAVKCRSGPHCHLGQTGGDSRSAVVVVALHFPAVPCESQKRRREASCQRPNLPPFFSHGYQVELGG